MNLAGTPIVPLLIAYSVIIWMCGMGLYFVVRHCTISFCDEKRGVTFVHKGLFSRTVMCVPFERATLSIGPFSQEGSISGRSPAHFPWSVVVVLDNSPAFAVARTSSRDRAEAVAKFLADATGIRTSYRKKVLKCG
jgi:hypothetical protein